MRIIILILILCVCLSQALFFDWLKNVLRGLDQRKVLKDFTDCGKRYERTTKKTVRGEKTSEQPETSYAECMWDCQWTRDNPYYKQIVDFPGPPQSVDKNSWISRFLPRFIVDRIENYAEEYEEYNIPDAIDVFVTMPKIPKDYRCLSDCWIHPKLWECLVALKEQKGKGNLLFKQVYYMCYAFLNSYPYENNNNKNYFIARNYLESAVEICLLSNLMPDSFADENGATCGTVHDDMNFDVGVDLPKVLSNPEDPDFDPLSDCKSGCIVKNLDSTEGNYITGTNEFYEDPECLSDCLTPTCVSELMTDFQTSGGVCAGSSGASQGWKTSTAPCVMKELVVWQGLCREETERKLVEDDCYFNLISLDSKTLTTVLLMWQSMCSNDIGLFYRDKVCKQTYGTFSPDSTTSPMLSTRGSFAISQCDLLPFTMDASYEMEIEISDLRSRQSSPLNTTVRELELHLGTGATCNTAIANADPSNPVVLDTIMYGSTARLRGFTSGHNIKGDNGREKLEGEDKWLMIRDSTGFIGCSGAPLLSVALCQYLTPEQQICSGPTSTLTYSDGHIVTSTTKSCDQLGQEHGERCTLTHTPDSNSAFSKLTKTCAQSVCEQTQTCQLPSEGSEHQICVEELNAELGWSCSLIGNKQICDPVSNSCQTLKNAKYLCSQISEVKVKKVKKNKRKTKKNKPKKNKPKKNKYKANKNKSKKNKYKANKNKSNKRNFRKNQRSPTHGKNLTASARLEGASIYPVDTKLEKGGPTSAHHPWMCSLRTRGFRGRHRCGLTLLSGPTEDSLDDPWVIVGAAHCNYICKDRVTGDPLETCCCRPKDNLGTCKSSPFCGFENRPVFALAESKDLVVVCGEFVTDAQNLELSTEPEQVFGISKIVNHPEYEPNREGIGNGGPIDGNDIAVYHVFAMDSDFKLGQNIGDNDGKEYRYIWPICLPKNDAGDDGFVTGWLDTPPVSQQNRRLLGKVSDSVDGISYNFLPRSSRMVKTDCEDPEWQKVAGVNTFYPPATTCFEDPSHASCIDFGSSGSGVVRKYKKYGTVKVLKQSNEIKFGTDDIKNLIPSTRDVFQYSFAGPLSMSKGCDDAFETESRDKSFPLKEFIFRGSNKAVATDASCFMDWIASEYNMKLENQYERKDSCFQSSGNKNDINREDIQCSTSTKAFQCSRTTIQANPADPKCGVAATCNFNYVDPQTKEKWDRCRLYADEGIAKNVFQCYVDVEVERDDGTTYQQTVRATCANNCKGVDPNSIIGGGVAAVFLGGLAAQGFLGPVAGAAGLMGVGGLGAMGFQQMMADSDCNPPLCRARSGQCCRARPDARGRPRCPDFCDRNRQ